MHITVREATPRDAEAIGGLATQTFNESFAWYNSPENMRQYTSTHFTPERIREELQKAGTWFFLAYDGELPVGYAKLRDTEHPAELKGKKHLEIERIYVLKSHHKQKVGYALMNRCIALAREMKLDCVWLGVWEKNEGARAFYEKLGFLPFGEHVFTLGDDLQLDHLLKLDLDQL